MNLVLLSMLASAVIGGMVASITGRSRLLWAILGLVGGPIVVAVILCLPSRRSPPPPPPPPSIADEIRALEEMRQRGILSNDEFTLGKAKVLAAAVPPPLPPAPLSSPAGAEGKRGWAAYQPAARAAFTELAARHGLEPDWPADVPFEVVCTYPVQPGLSIGFSLALEKGGIHAWGEGWALDGVPIFHPGDGLPTRLAEGLDAMIAGSGRIVTMTAWLAADPFFVALQVEANGRWRTVLRQFFLPTFPAWRRTTIVNADSRRRGGDVTGQASVV